MLHNIDKKTASSCTVCAVTADCETLQLTA